MRTWKINNATIYEEMLGITLCCFKMVVEGKKDYYIYPKSFQEMHEIILSFDQHVKINKSRKRDLDRIYKTRK